MDPSTTTKPFPDEITSFAPNVTLPNGSIHHHAQPNLTFLTTTLACPHLRLFPYICIPTLLSGPTSSLYIWTPAQTPCTPRPIPPMASAAPLLDPDPSARPRGQRVALIFALASFFLLVAVGSHLHGWSTVRSAPPRPRPLEPRRRRGSCEGVSEKSSGVEATYAWSNDELRWQRTAFHFQPRKNWMNDPNGPMYYKGWYHLFYQYNPYSAAWGNITWGHAVSRDLIRWLHLPLALVPDHSYDHNGVWSGSATLLPTGLPVLLYTGSTARLVQVQNLAFPADPSDPLLLRWTKSTSNPILLPPPGVAAQDFRDPTTAWRVRSDPDAWRFAIGAKDAEHAGIALVYRTRDFVRYELLRGALHRVPGTGMWECVDFYPLDAWRDRGLDSSAEGAGVKHVLKASLDDDKHDYYAIGTYDGVRDTWTVDDPERDVGLGLRYDYGKFYASKTFYDGERKRRVLWGWIGETDSESADLLKGWASVQSIPRTVLLDRETRSNLRQWPVEEVESLRLSSTNFSDVEIPIGSVVPLDVGEATQLDIMVEFEVNETALEEGTLGGGVGYSCSTSGGATMRGALGPFGLLVLADEALTEKTAVYFYLAKGAHGTLNTFICQDDLRSSLANDLVKTVYGSTVPVLDGEKLSVRILVDHSMLETFAQGGRTCITSRVYPTKIIHGGARLFLFNNATGAGVTATSVIVWQMSSAFTPNPGLD